MTPNQKIEICKKTREHAKKALFKVLQNILKNDLKPSEAEIRDMWNLELRKNDSILEDGWYSPPPSGIGILIGTDEDGEESRLNYKSLRPEEIWPKKDIYLNTKNGILYAYASSVDKETGIIGDFGMTIYFGKNKEIIDHLKLTYKIVEQVFNYVEPGQTFADVAKYMKNILNENNLNNEIECKANPSQADDVGHTIPFIMEDMSSVEFKILESNSQEKVSKMISEKRIFARASEDKTIKNGMAFTIEPRPRIIDDLKIPMVSFHSICMIYENGEKELITNFDEIFDLVGMKYMLK